MTAFFVIYRTCRSARERLASTRRTLESRVNVHVDGLELPLQHSPDSRVLSGHEQLEHLSNGGERRLPHLPVLVHRHDLEAELLEHAPHDALRREAQMVGQIERPRMLLG